MLRDLQRALAVALASNSPLETLKKEAAALSPEARDTLDRLNLEQFLLSSLLVRKLRFERICRGDTKSEEWFGRDPEGFTKAFQAYNAEIPPVEFFPRPEAQAFRAWCKMKGIVNPAL